MHLSWEDPRLAWDQAQWGSEIDALRVPHEEIYIPDISVYNGANQITFHQPPKLSNVLVYPSGKIIFVPSVTVTSMCNFNMQDWPFGEQNCTMNFGSWTMPKSKMDIIAEEGGFKLEFFKSNMV